MLSNMGRQADLAWRLHGLMGQASSWCAPNMVLILVAFCFAGVDMIWDSISLLPRFLPPRFSRLPSPM